MLFIFVVLSLIALLLVAHNGKCLDMCALSSHSDELKCGYSNRAVDAIFARLQDVAFYTGPPFALHSMYSNLWEEVLPQGPGGNT